LVMKKALLPELIISMPDCWNQQKAELFFSTKSRKCQHLCKESLRFMQNGEVRRIGSHDVRNVTVRVVAAANKNIDER